jgi:DNA-binding transcriptional LysR family regulator
MDLHKLRTFQAVVETGSFTAAGEKVLLSQSHVSAQIKALEVHYGVQLFDRIGRSVRLTEAGTILARYCQHLLALAEEAGHALDEYKGIVRGTLMIGASTTPGTYLMPQLLGTFRERYPQVVLHLTIGNSHQTQERIINGELELAVIGQPPFSKELYAYPFVEDEIVAIVSPRHPFAKRRSIRLAELADQEFILREEGSSTRHAVLRALGDRNVQLARTMELGSSSAVVRAVGANLGVSFLSVFAVEAEVALRHVVKIKVDGLKITRRLYVIWRLKHWASPAMRAFLQLIDVQYHRTATSNA